MTRDGLDASEALVDIQRAIAHRVAAHMAALQAAEALGWPGILSDAVAETEARHAEAVACLATVTATIAEVAPEAPRVVDALDAECDACNAPPGAPCVGVPGVHIARYLAAARRAEPHG